MSIATMVRHGWGIVPFGLQRGPLPLLHRGPHQCPDHAPMLRVEGERTMRNSGGGGGSELAGTRWAACHDLPSDRGNERRDNPEPGIERGDVKSTEVLE